MPTPGTQLMTNPKLIKEKETNPDLPLEESPFNQEMSLFSCQENIEEEELLY